MMGFVNAFIGTLIWLVIIGLVAALTIGALS